MAQDVPRAKVTLNSLQKWIALIILVFEFLVELTFSIFVHKRQLLITCSL